MSQGGKIDEIAVRTFNQAHPPGSQVYYRGAYLCVYYKAVLRTGLAENPDVWLEDRRHNRIFRVDLCDLGDPT